jgi:hypothetical protein
MFGAGVAWLLVDQNQGKVDMFSSLNDKCMVMMSGIRHVIAGLMGAVIMPLMMLSMAPIHPQAHPQSGSGQVTGAY